MMSARTSEQAFFGMATVLFAISAILTVVACASMSGMDGMSMPGGWTMSMSWMRMPGQTWPGAMASFLGIWTVMMVAMMLPSLVPALHRYRQAISVSGMERLDGLTLRVSVGYFLVWISFGAFVFASGVTLATLWMQHLAWARVAPAAAAGVVLVAGLLQFTGWKARHLAYCRAAPHACHALRADATAAWRYGVQLGLHCCYGCSGLTAVLLVLGVMDLRAMVAVTVAMTAERLAPATRHVVSTIGFMLIALGLWLLVRVARFI